MYFNNHNNDKDESNILDLTKNFISKEIMSSEFTQLILCINVKCMQKNLVLVTNARLCSVQSGKFMNVAKNFLKIVRRVRALPGVKK